MPSFLVGPKKLAGIAERPPSLLPSNAIQNMSLTEIQHSGSRPMKLMARRTPAEQRRLRVCMVAYTFYETDSRVMRYAETLVGRGDQVDVFALRRPGTAREERLHGVCVRRLQGRSFHERGRFSYLWRILLFLARAFFQVSSHDLQQKYDLVHVHSVPDFLVFSALLPRLRGTPVILDIRDILPEFYASKFGVSERAVGFRLMRRIEQLSSMFASHVITANHAWQERLLSRSVEQGGCSVMFNVPDRSIFVRAGKKEASSDRFVLLYHGTLNRHQGLDLAVRAFSKIKDLVPQADFHIYGDGPSKTELLALVRQLRLENRVILRGRKPLREISRVIESAQLGIVPKRKDNFGNEAFSTKTLEFMAMGVPVIVSDTKVDRYYLNESVVRFFRGHDEKDLARCMLDLIHHPEKRAALIEAATQFVENSHWALVKQKYLHLVDGLVASRALRPGVVVLDSD